MANSRRSGPVQHDPFSPLLPARTPGSTGMNDAGDPNTFTLIGDTPGPLGVNDYAAWLVSTRSSQYPQGRRPRLNATRAATELNIYGSFQPGPWKTDAEVVAAIRSGKDEWFPGTRELYAFAKSGKGTVVGAVNVWNVLYAIAQHHPHRVNIFTHATRGYIGLSGTVVRGNVYFSPEPATELSDEIITRAEWDDFSFWVGKSKHVTMKQVRAALPKNAEIIIYACHGGLDKTYLRKLSEVFSAKVKGFSKDIRYYPVVSKDGKSISGWRYSHGASQQVSDFHQLQPDISAP